MISVFPSPTGVNYYEYTKLISVRVNKKFPSPTGVNYYELAHTLHGAYYVYCFRPQQGLTIMNKYNRVWGSVATLYSFRPQQGLTIMNSKKIEKLRKELKWFPSPTGVNYYECLESQGYRCNLNIVVSVPNRG